MDESYTGRNDDNREAMLHYTQNKFKKHRIINAYFTEWFNTPTNATDFTISRSSSPACCRQVREMKSRKTSLVPC